MQKRFVVTKKSIYLCIRNQERLPREFDIFLVR